MTHRILAIILAAIATSACAVDEFETEVDVHELASIRELLCDFNRDDMTVIEPGFPYQIVSCGPQPDGGRDVCPELLLGTLNPVLVPGPFRLGDRVSGAKTDDLPDAICMHSFVGAPDQEWMLRAIPAQ